MHLILIEFYALSEIKTELLGIADSLLSDDMVTREAAAEKLVGVVEQVHEMEFACLNSIAKLKDKEKTPSSTLAGQ